MSMVTLKDPVSAATVCVLAMKVGTLSPDDIAALGYPGWTVVSESAGMPVEQMSIVEIETARLNTLTNAEMVAELKAWVTAHFTPQT